MLLVGHSYGGAVITQAGGDPEWSVWSTSPRSQRTWANQRWTCSLRAPTPVATALTVDQSGFITLTAQGIREDFAQDLSDTEPEVVIATLGPTSVAAGGTKITTAAWRVTPAWYAVAKRDRAISPDLGRLFAQRMNATSIELSSDQVPMLSRPADVAAFIALRQWRSGGPTTP